MTSANIDKLSIINDILTTLDNLKEKITSFEYLHLTSKLQSLYYLLSNKIPPPTTLDYIPSSNMIWRENPAYGMEIDNFTQN